MMMSAVAYGGALIAVAGLALAASRRFFHRRASCRALCAAIVGVSAFVVALGLPARDVVIASRNERLDTVIPRYQFSERHSTVVAALPLAVDSAIRAVTPDEIRFYQTLTWIRRFGHQGPEGLLNAPGSVPILSVAIRSGFHLLVDEPGRELVMGVTGPVSPAARAREASRTTHAFVSGAEGYASVAINFRIEPDGHGGSILSTATRVYAPDAPTRRRFAAYWRLIYPGSALIRRMWLRAIEKEARSAARQGHRL
jgi:hypothetical protein